MIFVQMPLCLRSWRCSRCRSLLFDGRLASCNFDVLPDDVLTGILLSGLLLGKLAEGITSQTRDT